MILEPLEQADVGDSLGRAAFESQGDARTYLQLGGARAIEANGREQYRGGYRSVEAHATA